jgi:hypothetical protein
MNFKILKIFIFLIFIINKSSAQNVDLYNAEIKIADTLFFHNNYNLASIHYLKAINDNGNKGKVIHRYRLASCYVLDNKFDLAFKELFYIAEKGNFNKIELLEKDRNFNLLHSDDKWELLLKRVRENVTD